MSRYSRGYIETHDIDWFCVVDGYFPTHVGSCGGMLPSFARDRERNRYWQSLVDSLPQTNEAEWNREYVGQRLERNTNEEVTPESFAENFLYFARRGFFSFYRDLPNEEDDNIETYSLIAWPNFGVCCHLLDIMHYRRFCFAFSSSHLQIPKDLKLMTHLPIHSLVKDWRF